MNITRFAPKPFICQQLNCPIFPILMKTGRPYCQTCLNDTFQCSSLTYEDITNIITNEFPFNNISGNLPLGIDDNLADLCDNCSSLNLNHLRLPIIRVTLLLITLILMTIFLNICLQIVYIIPKNNSNTKLLSRKKKVATFL